MKCGNFGEFWPFIFESERFIKHIEMLPPLLVEAEDIIRIYSEICLVMHSW